MFISNKNVLLYIDHYSRCAFFTRVIKGLGDIGYRATVITCKLSVYMALRRHISNVYLLKKNSYSIDTSSTSSSIDFLRGSQSLAMAKEIYQSTYYLVNELDNKYHFDVFLFWNGSTTCDLAIDSYAQHHKRKKLFFEVANLPGKIFVDPQGVNARSYLYEQPELLDDLKVNESSFECWLKTTFYEDKKKPPKQSLLLNKLNFFSLLDRVGICFMGVLRLDSTSFFGQVKQYFSRKSLEIYYDVFDLEQPYVFLPLQVCNDTQLLINSYADNNKAIFWAKRRAKSLGVPLLVKPHPAETDVSFLKSLEGLRKEFGFYLVNNNTVDLIRFSELVVVNNSNVGLESQMLGKKTEVIGKAIYQDFDKKRLMSYVQNYLFECDYFASGECKISEDLVLSFLKRAELS